MSNRPHRSIGEVLALLQGEFADITISKIRFLEAQGLIDPERTPSGYRKFYDDDIDTLRWILRQQRESFLPLKVIKDRLDANGGKVPPEDRPALWTSPLAGLSATTTGTVAEIDLRALAEAASAGEPPAVEAAAADPPRPAAPADRVSATAEASVAPTPLRSAAAMGAGANGAGETYRRSTAPYASRFVPDAGSVSLNAEELATASGLSAERIAEMERYGLVSGRLIGGDKIYDDDALVVCKLAAAFLAHGLEARHLRMYKVAAERESGMLAQVVAPLVRQRSAGRSAAVVRLEELASLGDALRDAMLRQALRDLLL